MTPTTRYKWLRDELGTIRTRDFHVVEGPTGAALRTLNNPELPASYREFVKDFGKAKLYKQKGGYSVGVLEIPEEGRDPDGSALLCLGHYGPARAYLRHSELNEGREPPIYEWGQAGLKKVADSFEEWLNTRSAAARKRFTKRDWERVLKGPVPFTEDEKARVEARRAFKWRVLGPTDSGKVRFEVRNESDRVLPYLTIGVRGGPNFEGAIWLPIAHVPPGVTALIEREVYSKQLNPDQVEFFDPGDPRPEDRDDYWEFRPLQAQH